MLMSKENKNESKVLEAVHETALGLHEAGVMDKMTMEKFDKMCLTSETETRTGLSVYINNIKQILKGGSKYRRWAVPAVPAAMAMTLAIAMVPALIKPVILDQPPDPKGPPSEKLTPMPEEPMASQRELVMARSAYATDKILLLVGTEERLKKDGFLKIDQYQMGTEPKVDNPQAKIVSIGGRLPLKPGQKLKVLIGRSGELKKGSDYQVEKSQDTTFITFTNDILSGETVLVVVETKN